MFQNVSLRCLRCLFRDDIEECASSFGNADAVNSMNDVSRRRMADTVLEHVVSIRTLEPASECDLPMLIVDLCVTRKNLQTTVSVKLSRN